jgi:hypothetical protein
MHPLSCVFLAGATALLIALAPAAEESGKPAGEPAGNEMTALETKFSESLKNVVFRGRWRMLEEGRLGAEQEDKYTISGAKKVGPGKWILAARIEYGGKDVAVPVPLDVHFAGDTPVLSLTNAGIPGLGTYSARVIVYEGSYAGTWTGPGCGGFVAGVIEKVGAAKESAPEVKPAERPGQNGKGEAPRD